MPILGGLSRAAAASFYRLQVTGPEVPRKGPVLLLANHPNSLLDPALVASAAGRPVRFLAKSTLFTDRRVGWLVRASGSIPVFRRSDDPRAASHNVQMFEAVFEQLARGSAVGIFPEGISHSSSSLARLKTGSARIALDACAQTGGFPLIPIGLVLRDKGVFRSEALVIRGEPVAWNDLVGRSAEDQQAVRELTGRLEAGLRQVTVNLEHWQDRPLVDCARAVWSAETAGVSDPVEEVRQAQTAARVLAHLRREDEGPWLDLARDVELHRRRLRLLGVEPADLHAKIDLGTGVGWTAKRLFLVGPPAVILGLLGAAVFWVPYQVTARVVLAMQPDQDQSSTYKVLVGAAVYLFWIVLITSVIGGYWGLGWGLVVALGLPLLGLAGLWIRESWRGAWQEVRRFFLFRSRREISDQLKREQADLASRLHGAYEDWLSESEKPV